MNKREAGLALIAAIAGAGISSVAAVADEAITKEDGLAAIMTWLDALQTGDPAVVDTVLAPDFQILRSNGQGYARKDYLSNLPRQTSRPRVTGLVLTSEKDTIVTRYILQVDQTIKGKPVQTIAPRLSVFRRSGTGWKIVAHANFARIG